MSSFSIKRLGPGDESVLEFLAINDADFDIPGRSHSQNPLSTKTAEAYLANPSVLHWVAYHEESIVGFLFCLVLPMRAGDEQELLLYEIGVHQDYRRQGIGRLLLAEMEQWMQESKVPEVWLGADNKGAEDFYLACGFVIDPERPVYMTRRLE